MYSFHEIDNNRGSGGPEKGRECASALSQCLNDATRLINRLLERRQNAPIRIHRRKGLIEDCSDVMQSQRQGSHQI